MARTKKKVVESLKRQIVHTPSLFSVQDDFEDDRFMKIRCAMMNTGENRNGSFFSKETVLDAKETFKNIPVLAYVEEKEDEDGNKYLDYTTHEMHIEEDYYDKDSQRMIYDERIVGIVPESNNFELIYDEETGNDYVYVDALLYRDYGNYCCDILESRGGTTDVSMEILCDDISVKPGEKFIRVGKMEAQAVTLLGADVTPGMAKAHATVFSQSEQKDRETQLMELLAELNERLSDIQIQNHKEGGKAEMHKELNEETLKASDGLAENDCSPEDVNFVEDEKKKKANGGSEDETVATEETPVVEEEPKAEPEAEPTVEEEAKDAEESTTEEEEVAEETTEAESEDEADEESEAEAETENMSASFSVCGKTFSVTLKEKLEAFYELINSTYGSDTEWFDVDVDEASKTIEFHDYWNNKHYRQGYSIRKGVYSLVGDRVETFCKYLTQDEITELESMKANYSSISEKLAQYEAEPEKIKVLESEDYSHIRDAEEFKELSKRENYFSMSKEEITEKLDGILLAYAKSPSANFSVSEGATVAMKQFGNPKRKASVKGRYGSTFNK